MTCRRARGLLSTLRDDQLERGPRAELLAHLQECAGCSERERSLDVALDVLAGLPRLEPSESLAGRVLWRLEVESRKPGLALIFRSVWAARPLILPSLLPAAAVVVAIIASTVMLEIRPESLPEVYVRAGSGSWTGEVPRPGTEQNPLFPSAEVEAPRPSGSAPLPPEVLAALAEGTFFCETVVARDGSVSNVTLIEGDASRAAPVLAALRRERFEPGLYHGRPVAVSLYRLISQMEVRAPLT